MTDLSTLNEQQRNAVIESINKNVVLMAGAGSGKTATLVKRTQYLIDDLGVSPENIMLITFTNKAANEIRERVSAVSNQAHKMWIGTFHRICTRLIRMHGSKLGIQNFTIMDTKEAKQLIKDILESKGVEYTPYLVNDLMGKISSYKNNLVKPATVLTDGREKRIYADVYQEYQNICWRRKNFDFDDLIIYAILLLSSYPDVLHWVHENIKYLMVDESQDTNSSQFQLIKLLAGNNNIMMVGDVNQSIYAFRNAKPQYLDSFVNTHPNTVKLMLERNYRSTRNIINGANAVIKANTFGTKLNMFCSNEDGKKIQLHKALDVYAEARWIAMEILMSSRPASDFAIIYRANFQSRVIEEELTKNGIGYTVFGAQSFYSRKEVKDLLAYCKAVLNPNDMDSFKRVLSTLKGVGKKTIEEIIAMATEKSLNFHDALGVFLMGLNHNTQMYYRLNIVNGILNKTYNSCSDILSDIIFLTEYRQEIANMHNEEAAEKLAIIDEFVEMIKSMEDNNADGDSMSEIIDQVSLLSETKGAEKANLNAVKLMTAHASKGLEFPVVFIIGAEEGCFPHSNSIQEGTPEAIEEERRLFYVAMTRAEKELYITSAKQKKTGRDGGLSNTAPSRFLREIPSDLTEDAF